MCIPVERGYENPACQAAADSLERRLAAGAENLLSDARAVAGKRRVIACVGNTFVIDPDKPKVVGAGLGVSTGVPCLWR